ncbi:MAG TPA: hypothetical protein VL971_06435, partial [Rhizomicrobium sp.]|nr:hypothetical protein [Rhizomicrobium sp.]
VMAGGFDASCNFLAGMTSSGGGAHSMATAAGGANVLYLRSSHAANPYGPYIDYTGAAPNGTGNAFLSCHDTGGNRASILSNGGLCNYSANNVNLSDARAKPQIELLADDDKLSAALWTAHKAVDWNRHKYADQTHDDWNYGYTAQGIQNAFGKVAPELVDTFDEKTGLLGVYHHDVTNIGGAVLAMAQTRIEAAEQKIAWLEARLTALEGTAMAGRGA